MRRRTVPAVSKSQSERSHVHPPPGSQSFFIYLQLSTVAGADKRLSCEGPWIPPSWPRVMIVKCMTGHTASTANVLHPVLNFPH